MKKNKFIIAVILLVPIVLGVLLSLNKKNTVNLISKKIGLVKVIGVIYSSEDYVRQLKEMREDPSIAGVLLRIESPGGAVAPSQEIYSEVFKFKKNNKPLVVSMGTVAASGGYYISSPASKIFANSGTLTGSIGVIFQFPQYYDLLNKIGLHFETIKAGELKDIANPYRKITPKEKKFLNIMIHDTHEQFIEDVISARPSCKNTLRKIADGRVLTGRQALKVGLVDSIGTYQDALSYLKQITNLNKNAKVIEKDKENGLIGALLENKIFGKLNILKNIQKPTGTYFLFNGYM